MKTLYVSDLDGTLLNDSSRIPDSAISNLNKAIQEGAQFTVATARTPATLADILKDVDLRLPAVVMTGATTWHRDSASYSDTHHFPSATARETLAVYELHHLPTFIYTLRDNRINIYHYGPLTRQEVDFIANRINSPYKHFHLSPMQTLMMQQILDNGKSSVNPDEIWEESKQFIPQKISDAVLFFAMQSAQLGAPVHAQLTQIPDINPIFYFDTVYPGQAMIEAFPGAASKAKAISNIARQIGADRIVAFGDNRNDLPMLEMADLAVAVENAIPEVKEIANVVIGECNTGAVAEFILEDFRKNNSLT